MRRILVLAVLASVAAASAQAGEINYYPVSGRTPLEIYLSLLAHGPRVGHDLAYATTTSHVAQQAVLRHGHDCSFADYRLRLSFTTILPRLADLGALNAGDRTRWRIFAAFVARHEATHRTIWTNCLQGLAAVIRSLRAPSCAALQRAAVAAVDAASARCSRHDAAFDRAQRLPLQRQPFILSVLRQARR